MRTQIRIFAGLCVLAATTAFAVAQHKGAAKSKPPAKQKAAKKVVAKSHKKSRAKHVRRRRGRRYVRRIRHRHSKRHVVLHNLSISSGAETGLVGIQLFDSGMKVLSVYGNPDLILNLGQGIPSAGPGPSGGGRGGGGGAGGGGGLGNKFGGRGGVARPRRDVSDELPSVGGQTDWGFQDDTLDRQFGSKFGGKFGGAGGGGGGQAPAAGGGAVGSAAEPANTYMRWVYKRTASQYSFIIDRLDRVVQIEVTGMDDSKVKTRKGVTFGATFHDLMKIYGIPDAYEINGDQLVMRYLAKNHVAFRLNRLQTDHPHEVTAIVVAGGRG